ncbi:MAG: YafY family protein [bacterium]
MATDQLVRQWSIIQSLIAKKLCTLEQLADDCGVTTRTVRRDLQKIEEAGFPLMNIRREGKNTWRFIDGFARVPPIAFTPTELFALVWTSDLLRVASGPLLKEDLKAVIKKIRSTLGSDKVEYFQRLQQGFSVSPGVQKDYTMSQELLRQLTAAVISHTTTEIHYHSLNREKPEVRKVDPYKIWYQSGGLYLIGYCHLRKEIRMFAVDRIKFLNVTREGFFVPENFDFDEYIKDAFNVIVDEPVTVKIRFDKSMARYIEERIWHPSQKIARQKGGGITMTLTVGGTLEIRNWAMSFGSHATVLEPDGLRQEIQSDINRMRQNYGLEPTNTLRAPERLTRYGA